MSTKIFIDHIRQHIANDEIKEALAQLRVFLENSPKLNEVLLQSARYQDVLKQIRMGVAELEEANITKNQIRFGLLELVSELEVQEASPPIKEEMEKAISIVNSKNVVVDSNLSAGRDIQIGDTNIHTESKMSKGLRLFLFIFVPLLAIGSAYFWYNNQVNKRPLTVKVLVENQTPNPELPEPAGTLTLTYGGEAVSKEAISKEAIFENIPSNFRSDFFRLKYEAFGFALIDTAFNYDESIILPVHRNDDLASLKGYVYEEGTDPLEGLGGVKVSISCCSVKTDASGYFNLSIPSQHQRQKQRLEFYKENFHQKSTTEPVLKGNEIRTYLSRK